MTASRRDPPVNGSLLRVPGMWGRAWMFIGFMLAGCRAGLPPEPPGADAADPAAASAPYELQPNPYETSAFAGEPAPKADAMDNMDHGSMGGMDHGSMGNMDHGSNAGAKQAPAPAAPAGQEREGKNVPAPAPPTQPDHTGHGAAPKKAVESPAMPPNMPMPETPR